jgi:ubiquinone biosynthesis protein UbiJ
VGDAAAHRLVASAQAVVGQADQARRRLTDNLVEYLTEEQPTLVTRAQLNAHAEAVRTLADDLDRLEKRLARLR